MAGQIVVTLDGGEVGRFTLDKESMVVGRKPDSDIHIDNLAVSGKHARVITILDDSFVEDLGSTNGTFVNGKRITKQPLKDGDEITIGRHVLRFSASEFSTAGRAEGGEGFAETIILSPGDNQALKQASSQAEAARAQQADASAGGGGGASATIGPARIRLVDGGNKELPLSKALTTLGKPGVQVAAISRRQNGDFLVHVDGGAGDAKPLVNGTRMAGNSQKLSNEDVVEIAGVKMQYLIG